MSTNKDEYVAVRDGAITYFREEDRDDDLIKLYEKSKDIETKMKVVTFIKQRNERKKVFLSSMEEFNKLKEEIEEKAKKGKDTKEKVDEKEQENKEREIGGQTSDTDDDTTENNSNDKKDTPSETKELGEKSKKVEESGRALIEDMSELNQYKESLMKATEVLRYNYGS